MSQQFRDVLMALNSMDAAVRVPAEQVIVQARENDLPSLLVNSIGVIGNEGEEHQVRAQAVMVLKNAVVPSIRDAFSRKELEGRWRGLAPDVRQGVKQGLLTALGTSNTAIRNMVASAVGSLSRIELPAGEWPDLIQVLVAGVQQGTEAHQEAALTAIGYICEEGDANDEVEEALKPHTTLILGAIVQCMSSSNEDVRFSATNALCNAMDYIHNNMEQQNQRDFLVDALCTTASTCQVERTRQKAMESLVKVAELYYSALPQYIKRLHTITTDAIFKDAPDVGLQAIQFWISICEVERDMQENDDVSACLHYGEQGMGFLTDICLQLLTQQEEGQTEDDWNLSVAGGKLLRSVCEVVGIKIQQVVMPFVYSNINSENWHQREAAVMAFGCVVCIPGDEAMDAFKDTVAQGVPGLLIYLTDSNELVADTSAWVLAMICEGYVDVFLDNPQQLQRLLNIIGPMINNATAPEMAVRACHIVHNLGLAYEDEEDQTTNALSAYFGDLVTVLLQAIDNGQTPEVRATSQETLNVLVDASAADCVPMLAGLVPELHNRMQMQLNSIVQMGNNITEDAEALMGLLCGALGAMARKLAGNFVQYLDRSMELLIALLQVPKDYVQDEVLVCIGTISYAAKARMEPYLPRVVPFVLQALNAFDEPDSVFAVAGAIGDLSLSCQECLRPFAGDIMNTLFTNLTNNEVDRSLKCTFLSVFGDVIMQVLHGEHFRPYMATLMPTVNEMFLASRTIDFRNDADSEEYVMTLWESTASFYSTVTQCFKENHVDAIVPYLPNMLEFALHAASQAREYVETFDAALMVIGDMAAVLRAAPDPQLRQQAKNALVNPSVMTLVENAVKSASGDTEKTNRTWVRKQLMNLQKV